MAKNSNTYKTFNVNEKTPSGFYNQLNDEFYFDFDPCPFPKPNWDGLRRDWGERNYCNPPYKPRGTIAKWVDKAQVWAVRK